MVMSDTNPIDGVRVVLVNTSHPGNIGSAARAMKTMGLADLALVNPKTFPAPEATAMASGADDLLAKTTVHASTAEAIADCGFVVGASARLRSLPWPTVDPRRCAEGLWQSRLGQTKVALLFGSERAGLDNEDLALCHQLVHIPANPDYSSLNLAQAVQILCYELRMAGLSEPVCVAREDPLASADALQGFHDQLQDVLTASGFLKPGQTKQMLLRLRRLFNRAEVDTNEVNILRGVLTSLDPRRGPGGAT